MAEAQSEDLAAQLRRLQADLDAVKNTLKETGQREARSAAAGVEAYLRENPRTVIAGAVGLGVLLGLMLRRH